MKFFLQFGRLLNGSLHIFLAAYVMNFVFYGLFHSFLLRYGELLNYYTTVGTLAFHNSYKIVKGRFRLLDGLSVTVMFLKWVHIFGFEKLW